MFTKNCDKWAFFCSSWSRLLLLAGIFPFFLSVQDALIPARFNMRNHRRHSRNSAQCQPDWFIGRARAVKQAGGAGREEETEMRNERELEAVQTVGPPRIYDACRRTINANVPATASRSILGRVFGHFGRERKNDPSLLHFYLLITISSNIQKLAFNHGKYTNIFLKSDVI